jgi:hypothetical protein
MSRLDSLPERALELVSQVGDNLRHAVPDGAGKWLDAGIKLGAVKTGARVAGTFVRRNPAAFAAAAAGAGLLWLVARHRAKKAEEANGQGNGTSRSRRVEAKRSPRTTRASRSTAKR